MLRTPTPDQNRLLSAFHYQRNEALLHTDASVMPQRRLAWASWTVKMEQHSECHGRAHGGQHQHRHASTHYWMNALQGVSQKKDYFVSLNSGDRIEPGCVLYSTEYEHPIFTLEAIRAQHELPGLNLKHEGRLFFCGSYFRYGFHEDACLAGFQAAAAIRKKLLDRTLVPKTSVP